MKIFVTEQFEALHKWSDAPDETAFLRNPHRHLFKVRLEASVNHDDRELEFFAVKEELARAIKWAVNYEDAGSCEQIAKSLLTFMRKALGARDYTCEVSEDGENGAIVSLNKQGVFE